MNDTREKSVLLNSLSAQPISVNPRPGIRPWHARKLAGLGTASSLLLVALCAAPFAPVTMGQGATGAAAPASAPAQSQTTSSSNALAKQPATATTQASGQSSANASTQTDPQMQDQSAPPADSLGEAARKARAQKAKAATPKVFTDDSVSTLSGHGVSVVGDGKAGSGSSYSANSNANSGGSGGGPGAGSGTGSQEQYWRGRAQAIRNQMAQCDQRISEIQDEIAKHGAVTVDPQSGAQAGVIFVEDRNAQIRQVEQQKAGLQNQLEALEDEGRKAGADSGWFR